MIFSGMGGQYSPGFLTDLVREIRDAARMREEAMYARLRAMLLERTDVCNILLSIVSTLFYGPIFLHTTY